MFGPLISVLAVILGLVLVGPISPANADPAGNNGTVKVDDDPNFGANGHGSGGTDNGVGNDPHLGCNFQVEWYGFDKGDNITSHVTFAMQAPTADVGMTVTGPSDVFVGADDNSGGGSPAGLDGKQDYSLSFDGPGQKNHGYHVKLTIYTPGSQGNDTKSKVFWVEGCEGASAAVTFTDPTCTTGQQVSKGAISHATWGEITDPAGSDDYLVTATAWYGYVFPGGDTTKTFRGELAGPDSSLCPEGVAPTPSIHIEDHCGTADDEALTYTDDNQYWTAETVGNTVVFHAKDGYYFDPTDPNTSGADNKTYTRSFTPNSEDFCPASAEVDFTNPSCDEGGTATPGDTTGADWAEDYGTKTGSYSFTAVAESGYKFFDDEHPNGMDEKTFAGELSGPTGECSEASAEIRVSPATCTHGATAAPGDINNATWAEGDDTVEGEGDYSFTATASGQHTFAADDDQTDGAWVTDEGTVKHFAGHLGGPDGSLCPDEVIPVTPAVTMDDQCGTANDSGPTYTAENEYWTTTEGADSVAFHAKDGYYFPAGDNTSEDGKTYTVSYTPNTDESCGDASAGVNFTDPTCDTGATATPGAVTNATWDEDYSTVTGPGSYSFVAHAVAGYHFPAGPNVNQDGTMKTFSGELPGSLSDTQDCTVQPEPTQRSEHMSEQSCDLGGVHTWDDVYTTTYAWDEESGTYVGTETGPVAENDQLTPYTAQQAEDLGCVEVEGEQTHGHHGGGKHHPEVKGEQAHVPAVVPTQVEAGLAGTPAGTPAGGSSNNLPLWALTLGAGMFLVGAGRLRRTSRTTR